MLTEGWVDYLTGPFGIAFAFAAGVISFLSPCVLPLVPGYVSLISGVGVEQLKAQEKDSKLLSTLMRNSLMFILGFSLVFIALGAVATTVGTLLAQYKRQLAVVAGAVIVVFGLHLTGIIKIQALYADKRLHSVKATPTMLGSFLVGFAFAFGWTPCVGPILSAVITVAATEDSVLRGIVLLAIYSAGLAVPFLLTAFGIDYFLEFYSRFRRHLNALEICTGVLLIFFGVLVALNRFQMINAWLSQIPVFKQVIGVI